MSRPLSSVLPLMLLMLVAIIISVEAGLRPKKRTVRITNALGVYGDLVVHCKSKDDDLGDHLLLPGESFEFRFRQNIFGTTLFFCSFRWSTEFHYYDVYRADRDGCSKCYWTVYFLGICFHDQNCYPWPVQSGRFINP